MTPESKQTNVRLSVIIPCFNHGKFIMDAISSVESCQSKIYEIVIVNDGSTDPFTCEVMSELKRKGYTVIEQENQGLSAARNTGIKMAKGEYILPLDSDNKIRPDYIYKSIDILDRLPKVGVVYSNVEYFGEMTSVWETPDFDLPRLLTDNYIDACAVFRKSVWEDCGHYDTKMFGYEDWDLWISAVEKGWLFYHIPEVLFDYRVRSNSMIISCRIPENHKHLVQYITAKHAALFREELIRLSVDLATIRGHYLYKLYQRLTKFWRLLKLQVKALLKPQNQTQS